VHNLEVNATNAAMLARKKEAAQKEAETDAAIAAYVREREAREQVSKTEAGVCTSIAASTTVVMTSNQEEQEDDCTSLKSLHILQHIIDLMVAACNLLSLSLSHQ
jgi:dihydroorotase-like cyclic amidohydrolase